MLIDLEQLASLPAHEITTATTWTASARFSGPRFTDVLAKLGAHGSKVSLVAIDDYKVDLSMADIEALPADFGAVDGRRTAAAARARTFLADVPIR